MENLKAILIIVVAASPILLGLFFFTKRVTSDWEDSWKFIAWLPFLGMLGVAIAMGLDQANLWPIALIVWGLCAFFALAVLAVIGTFFLRSDRDG